MTACVVAVDRFATLHVASTTSLSPSRKTLLVSQRSLRMPPASWRSALSEPWSTQTWYTRSWSSVRGATRFTSHSPVLRWYFSCATAPPVTKHSRTKRRMIRCMAVSARKCGSDSYDRQIDELVDRRRFETARVERKLENGALLLGRKAACEVRLELLD